MASIASSRPKRAAALKAMEKICEIADIEKMPEPVKIPILNVSKLLKPIGIFTGPVLYFIRFQIRTDPDYLLPTRTLLKVGISSNLQKRLTSLATLGFCADGEMKIISIVIFDSIEHAKDLEIAIKAKMASQRVHDLPSRMHSITNELFIDTTPNIRLIQSIMRGFAPA